MSAQTDCEMLSIEVMEAYAGKYNLSGNKVVELFQKNQVFEKMLFSMSIYIKLVLKRLWSL